VQIQERVVKCRLIPRLHAVFKSVLWDGLDHLAFRDEHQNTAGHEDCNPVHLLACEVDWLIDFRDAGRQGRAFDRF